MICAVGPDYGFGLYIHWPYCARICPYCDFNVYAAKNRDPEPLLATIQNDIRAHRTRIPDHPKLDSVFLGGGTPSLLHPHALADLIETAEHVYGLKPDAEITIEANPNDILRSDLEAWAAVGINRVSLGIQSLDDRALAFLGRDHNSTDARRAVERIQAVFENHSVDLIYARPGQTPAAWARELTAVLRLGAPHLSLYELTIEASTAFGKRAARGELLAMPDEAQADLYELTQSLCEAAGLPAYEISNHAREPRFESRHNHIYWASGDWIGVGPGAHGRLTDRHQRWATLAPLKPADYLLNAQTVPDPLSQQDTAHEFLTMALRRARGLDLERFERLFGAPIDPETVRGLCARGLAELTPKRLGLTVGGRLLADHIAAQLTPY
ncbi:MAG: radical SAM family heme chaperone HemW [Pseudomonadota bacterium]